MLRNFFRQIKQRIDRTDTGTLFTVSGMMSLLIGFLWITIYRQPYSGKPVEDLVAILIFFFCGLSGFFVVMRKEAPFFLFQFEREGMGAVIYGLLFVVLGWGMALLVLFRGLLGLF